MGAVWLFFYAWRSTTNLFTHSHYSLIHSPNHSLTHLTHLLTHPTHPPYSPTLLTHLLTHPTHQPYSLTYSPTLPTHQYMPSFIDRTQWHYAPDPAACGTITLADVRGAGGGVQSASGSGEGGLEWLCEWMGAGRGSECMRHHHP